MDFSLTSLFVMPKDSTLATTGSTQDLLPGKIGFFDQDYKIATAGNVANAKYWYIAQGKDNNYLSGSKRSDKIKGCATANCNSNVISAYKITACPTAAVQITEISDFSVRCGEAITVTLRLFSDFYISALYHNGLTRSVTVEAPCCDCGDDPCDTVDVEALVDKIIAKFLEKTDGANPDNSTLTSYLNFEKVGTGDATKIVVTAKPIDKYGKFCDVTLNQFDFDRVWFRTFVYVGPATTVDFIVPDSCNTIATVETIQESTYARGMGDQLKLMELQYHSYQSYLKHTFTKPQFNQDFESHVVESEYYDTFYIKFRDWADKTDMTWNWHVGQDETVILAAVSGSAESTAIQTFLTAAIGTLEEQGACITTTTTTTTAVPTTTTTTTL